MSKGIVGSEYQSLDQDITLRDNDRELRRAVASVVSRESFATSTVEYTATASIDPRYSRVFVNPTTTTTLTLPYANYWGDDRSPVMTIVNTGSLYNVTLAVSGSDTINGLSSYSLRAGDRIDLISDGATKWYLVEPRIAPRKNIVIGGNFSTNPWQRGTTFTSPSTGARLADGFSISYVSSGVVTVTKTADTPGSPYSSPAGGDCIHVDVTTADASIAAGDFMFLRYAVEGYDWAQLAFEPCVLSFWHKHTKTGIYCVSVRNSGSDRTFVAEYTQDVSDQWEYAELPILGSPAAGTWNYGSGTGLVIQFCMAAGSTYHTTAGAWQTGNYVSTANQVNALDSTSNNCKFNLIQLEPGSKASPFEVRHLEEEWALCQRYLPSTNALRYAGQAYGTTSAVIPMPFRVLARAAPTGIVTGTIGNYFLSQANLTATALSSMSFSAASTGGGVALAVVGSAVLTAGNGTTLLLPATDTVLWTGAEL